ncbi:MAG: ParA family protein [Oligoflexia bacterium]|nr:ParA family protein [Oligoflexia bacterium]
MISALECSELLQLTPVRIKQLLKEINDGQVTRTKTGPHGKIKITHTEVRELLFKRKLCYRNTVATVGMEKGGVGKSLLTCNVAIKKAQLGAKVLIIDLDPEACATNFFLDEKIFNQNFLTMLEVFKESLLFKDAILPTKYEGLDIVPCRGKARRAEKFVRDENLSKIMKATTQGLREVYDLILFEVPPTFSNIIASAYISSDIVVMPTFPDAWSMESILLTIEDIKEEAEKWGVRTPDLNIVLNKYSPTKTASKEAWEVLLEDFKGQVLPFQIRESADLQNSINNGVSVFESRASKFVRESIMMLADFICPLIDKENRDNNSTIITLQ